MDVINGWPPSREDIFAELDHISNWAASNNLRLNPGKSREMIISRKRKYDSQSKQNADIERVKSMKILGVRPYLTTN